MRKRGLIIFALLSLAITRSALAEMPPDNVQGDWTIYSTNIQNGETVVKHVQIAQYGNRITGYFEGPNQQGPIQGRINVHHIVFSTVTRNVLTFRGQIYGDQMSGAYGIHGKHAAWQAVRQVGTAGVAVPQTGVVYSSQPILAPPGQTPPPAFAPQPASYNYSSTQQSTQLSNPGFQSARQTATQPAQYSQQTNPAPTPAPLSPDQLDSLVAPIALYPDALVAQVLAAATNPDQVAYADDWLSQNKNLNGTALAQAVDQQSWDPSIKALTQFPLVMDNLAHNLSWTSSLGQAFANQQPEVMAAVQTMRARAQTAGTLQSNSQITVTQSTPSTIVIQPANPQVVYVPQYNPTVVYGAPVVVPLYVPPPVPVAAVGLYYGTGITIGATFGGGGWGGGFGWGWHAWGVNWGCCGGGSSTTIIYNHNTYINNHTWNNTNYHGYHPWGNGGTAMNGGRGYYGNNGYYHPDPGYHPGADTHYGPNGAYHPNGYFGPNGGWHENQTGPNGGNNGNHGLIGGNGGVQNPNAGKNGPGVAPNGGYTNNGLIGSNRNDGGAGENANRSSLGAQQNRSRFSGDGRDNRMESNRGRASMGGHRSEPHMARMHAPAEHHFSGGGRRR